MIEKDFYCPGCDVKFKLSIEAGNSKIGKTLDWIDCFCRCPVCHIRLQNCGEVKNGRER